MRIDEIVQEKVKGNLRLEPSDLSLARPAIATPKDIADSGIQKIAFIGPNAKTFDKKRANTARKMYKRGATPDEIWNATKTFIGPDGNWRQEVQDGPAVGVSYAKLGIDDIGKNLTLSDIIDHPELFSAYPGLKNMKFRVEKLNGDIGGWFEPETGTIVLGTNHISDPARYIKSIHHEIQHAIQSIEDWQNGGNTFSDVTKNIANNDSELFTSWADLVTGNYYMNKDEMAKYLVYKSYGGEAAAREVEDRIMGLYDEDPKFAQQFYDYVKPAIGKDMPYLTYDKKDMKKTPGITTGNQKTIDSPEFHSDNNYHDSHDSDGNQLNFPKISENFADGKVKGKSRPGRVKRAGASCNGSVTELRKKAKNASGEKAKMYHWCANMKSGRKKK